MESKELLEVYGDQLGSPREARAALSVNAPGFSTPDFRQLAHALWWPSVVAATLVCGIWLFVLWTH